MSKKFYAVKTRGGRELTFTNWKECEEFVKGRSNVTFKGFNDYDDVRKWFKNQTIIDNSDGVSNNLTYAYVDGSYNKNLHIAGWAFAVVEDDKVIHELSGAIMNPESRQIDGELWAAFNASDWAYMRKHPVVIVHDYAGIGHFVVGNWTPKSNVAITYCRLMKPIFRSDILTFKKIPGHSGNKWNDYVDILAKKACGVE